MAAGTARLGPRRVLVGVVLAVLVGAAGVVAADADGALTITPERGEPGITYEVRVACGSLPRVYLFNTQDARTQGTIPSFHGDQVTEVAPSAWAIQVEAGNTDDEFWAECGRFNRGVVGRGRFDAESPHLWLGPRPVHGDSPHKIRTALEGTDCPDGTKATVEIASDAGNVATTVTIDQYGGWSVPLPAPEGAAEMHVTASCGSVRYADLVVTSTATTTSAPATQPPNCVGAVPPNETVCGGVQPAPGSTPAPATPVAGAPAYTG